MKALFIILFLSSVAFGQENPWQNKNTKNPWGNQTKKVEQKDTIKTAAEQPKKDTIIVKEVESKSDELLTFEQEKILIESARQKVASEYKSGNDFAVGFTTGLFMNFLGLVPDIPYVLIDSKQEKQVQSNITSDSTYVAVNDHELRTETEKTIKSKKIFWTMRGTAVGSLVQIFAFILIGSALLN
tara:strand:+ start:1329 stop:1883 length:555 start_codon:yes stop_codon:yes gene_type:complete